MFSTERYGISVVMPVHNGGQYLQAAVDSILKQQEVLFELLIVDDHSSDGAIEQLTNDPRIRVLQASQCGIVPALNLGMKQARFPYIARMDGDDVSLPHRLITQLRYLLDNPDVDIVGGQVEMFKDNEPIQTGYALYQRWINTLCDPASIAKSIFIESPIPHPSAFFRRATLESLGGYIDHPWPEDYDLWLRAYLAGLTFGKPDNNILLRWRDHAVRASRQQTRYTKQQFLRCKAHYLAQFLDTRGIRQCSIWGTGPTGLKLHDYLEDNGVEVSGFVDVNPKMAGRHKRNKPVELVVTEDDLPHCRGLQECCLIAVSARGAREKIHSLLTKGGFYEGSDFILVA